MKTFTNLKIVRQTTTYGVFITFVMLNLICVFQLKSQNTQMQTNTLDRTGSNYIISENNDKQHNFLVQHNTHAPYINCTQVTAPQTENNDTLVKSTNKILSNEMQLSFPDFLLNQLNDLYVSELLNLYSSQNDYKVSKKYFANQPISTEVYTKNYKITFTYNRFGQLKGIAKKTFDDDSKNNQPKLKLNRKYLRKYNKIEKFTDNESLVIY